LYEAGVFRCFVNLKSLLKKALKLEENKKKRLTVVFLTSYKCFKHARNKKLSISDITGILKYLGFKHYAPEIILFV